MITSHSASFLAETRMNRSKTVLLVKACNLPSREEREKTVLLYTVVPLGQNVACFGARMQGTILCRTDGLFCGIY